MTQRCLASVAAAVLVWWLFRPGEEEETSFQIPDGKCLFEPSFEWKEVASNHVCPPGLEFRLDLATGVNMARIPPP